MYLLKTPSQVILLYFQIRATWLRVICYDCTYFFLFYVNEEFEPKYYDKKNHILNVCYKHLLWDMLLLFRTNQIIYNTRKNSRKICVTLLRFLFFKIENNEDCQKENQFFFTALTKDPPQNILKMKIFSSSYFSMYFFELLKFSPSSHSNIQRKSSFRIYRSLAIHK